MAQTPEQTAATRIRFLARHVDETDRNDTETSINLIYVIASKAAAGVTDSTNKFRYIADECGRVDRADEKEAQKLLNLIRMIFGQ